MADLSFSGSSDPVCIFNDTSGNQLAIDSSGRPTVNQGSPNTNANAWPAIITDGTNTAAVTPNGSLVSQSPVEYLISQDKTFSVSGDFTAASGGADNPIYLIKNPSGSGKTLRLRRLYFGVTVTNVFVEFKIFYAPTITSNGTSQTPHNNLIGSSTASSMQVFSLPTLSSNGTQISAFTIGQNSAMPEINPLLDIQANQNIVITANPSSNNRAIQITAIWSEV